MAEPQITYLKEVDSTNRALRERLQTGTTSSAVLWAGQQSAGRGRLGRKWESPEGGLYYSIATSVGQCSPPLFGFAAGLAAYQELATLSSGVRLKWPNDLLALGPDGQEHKLGGMLSEYVTEGVHAPHVIVGLGININTAITLAPDAHGPSDALPPISLSALTGETHDIAAFVQKLTARIYKGFEGLLALEQAARDAAIEALHQGWSTHTSTLQRRVRVEAPGRTIEGNAESLDASFALCLRDDTGELHTIQAGDCIHLR